MSSPRPVPFHTLQRISFARRPSWLIHTRPFLRPTMPFLTAIPNIYFPYTYSASVPHLSPICPFYSSFSLPHLFVLPPFLTPSTSSSPSPVPSISPVSFRFCFVYHPFCLPRFLSLGSFLLLPSYTVHLIRSVYLFIPLFLLFFFISFSPFPCTPSCLLTFFFILLPCFFSYSYLLQFISSLFAVLTLLIFHPSYLPHFFLSTFPLHPSHPY